MDAIRYGLLDHCDPRAGAAEAVYECAANLACVGAEYRRAREFIELRYPFFKSDSAERDALFGPGPYGAGAWPRSERAAPSAANAELVSWE